jgi:hypothetical protein
MWSGFSKNKCLIKLKTLLSVAILLQQSPQSAEVKPSLFFSVCILGEVSKVLSLRDILKFEDFSYLLKDFMISRFVLLLELSLISLLLERVRDSEIFHFAKLNCHSLAEDCCNIIVISIYDILQDGRLKELFSSELFWFEVFSDPILDVVTSQLYLPLREFTFELFKCVSKMLKFSEDVIAILR